MDRIITTGGNGFIGRYLIQTLLSSKHVRVISISNTINSIETLASDPHFSDENLTFHTADIRDRQSISDIFSTVKADTCVHLAAKVSVADSIVNPNETMEINVDGTRNVLEACHQSGIRNFIFASSAAVYGDVTELPISENQVLRPLSPYGTSKMLAEQQVSLFAKMNKIENAVILRLFNVYGKGQSGETDVVSKFIARLSRGLAPLIFDDGNRTRDFVSIEDVIRALLLSIKLIDKGLNSDKNDANLPAVFNIGTGVPTSIIQLAKKVIQAFGLDLVPINTREKVDNKNIMHSYADTRRAREVLHFVSKIAIDEGLREMIIPMMFRK